MINKLLSRPNYLPFKRFFWKNWYNIFASQYSNVDIVFMNYGYADLEPNPKPLQLNVTDEGERYCIQLYHHVANAISLENLDVLEVGCGRGGGSYYIQRFFKPRSITGVDFSESNIELCNKKYSVSNLKFCPGDAESLPFPDSSFDAIINIESSHCYGSEERFFAEVFRVLRPQGHFLFADFRPNEVLNITKERLKSTGFKTKKEETISKNVLKSMDLENQRKLTIIQEKNPKYLHQISKWFAATQGTPVYEAFKNGELEYFYYVLQKN